MKIRDFKSGLLLLGILAVTGVAAEYVIATITAPERSIMVIPEISTSLVNFTEDMKQKVIDIAKNDSKIAKLLREEGYVISDVRPVYKLKLSNVHTDGTNVTLYRINESICEGASLVLKKEKSEIDVFINVNTGRVELIWDATNFTVIYDGS